MGSGISRFSGGCLTPSGSLVNGHTAECFHAYSMISNHQVYPLKTKRHLKSSQSQCPELLSTPELVESRHSFIPVNNSHTSQLGEGRSEANAVHQKISDD